LVWAGLGGPDRIGRIGDMRTVHIVSWHSESFGGFDWYPNADDAASAYERELTVWGNDKVRVRLLSLEVEDTEDRGAITDEIDSRLDEVEVTAPALRDEVTR
jgi:hypothetical protein